MDINTERPSKELVSVYFSQNTPEIPETRSIEGGHSPSCSFYAVFQ